MTTTRGPCGRCGARVVWGVDRLGFSVVLDDVELDQAAELDALLSGLRTWTHHTAGDELAYRGARAIRHRPAVIGGRTVVRPGHRCHPLSMRGGR